GGGHRLVLGLEEAEERDALVVDAHVLVVLDVRHAPDDAAVAAREVEGPPRVPPQRVLALVEEGELGDPQGRHPDRVPPVLAVRVVDELPQPPAARGRLDGELSHVQVQMTPRRLPTTAKAERSLSSCSLVWFAFTLVRMIACPFGTPGGSAGVVNTP